MNDIIEKNMTNYLNEVNLAVTICDKEGKTLWMNERSKIVNGDVTGENLLDCHPEPAKSMLIKMLNDHNTNAYTIEKGSVKKLIYQTPWYEGGEFAGYIELSMEIPFEMPHFVRKP